VELGGLGSRVGTELVGQPLAETFIGGQRRSWPAGQLLGQHQRPVGVLVERVVGHGGQGQFDPTAGLAQRQRRAPRAPPGAAQQPPTVPPGLVHPGGRGLVGEDLTTAKQVQRATSGDRSERRVASSKVGFGP
jgi:hypothetical protein